MNPSNNPLAKEPRDGDYARYVEEMVARSARELQSDPSRRTAWDADESDVAASLAAATSPSPSPPPVPETPSRNRPPPRPPGPPPRSRAPAKSEAAAAQVARAAAGLAGIARWLVIAGVGLILASIVLGGGMFPAAFFGFVLIALGVSIRNRAARR